MTLAGSLGLPVPPAPSCPGGREDAGAAPASPYVFGVPVPMVHGMGWGEAQRTSLSHPHPGCLPGAQRPVPTVCVCVPPPGTECLLISAARFRSNCIKQIDGGGVIGMGGHASCPPGPPPHTPPWLGLSPLSRAGTALFGSQLPEPPVPAPDVPKKRGDIHQPPPGDSCPQGMRGLAAAASG